MENTWFTSDTHFGHKNIIPYSQRPFKDVDEMNEVMVQNWNKLVKPGDIVRHNGDFSFQQYEPFKKFIWQLNGQIHLVLGNHDKMIIQHKNEILKQGKIVTIQHYDELKIGGQMIVLFHYGCRVWNKSHHSSILLYGHSHGSLPPYGKSVDIGVDCKEVVCVAGPQGQKTQAEYRPIHLDEILKYMEKRETPVSDHHGRKEMDL